MSDDLTERLRVHYKVECRRCTGFNSDMSGIFALTNEAADRIDSLTAERDALRSLLAECEGWLLDTAKVAESWAPEWEDQLTACRARVREALGGES